MRISIRFLGVTALLFCLSLAQSAHANQLQCNSKAVAEQAVALAHPGSILLDFCSLCDSKVQVVRIAQSSVVEDCEWEVSVQGTITATTTKSLDNGKGVESASYETRQMPYAARVDLAYVYIETAPNKFEWLGGKLGLKADVNVKSITLPAKLYEGLGPHTLPSINGAVPGPAPTAPTGDSVQQVWEYYYHGQGGAPVLVRLTPCVEVDLEKESANRYDCAKPLQGTIKKGDSISAWMSWLVPAGDEVTDIMVQWLHEGIVRSTKDLSINGKGFRYRTFTSKTLRKAGRWEVVVRQGERELGRAEIEVDE